MQTLEQLRAGALTGTRHLKLGGGLKTFPEEIFTLADTLEVLDLSGNALTELPERLPELRRLRVLFCSGNPFQVLPAVVGACEELTMVGFKSCHIERVPPAALPPRLRWLILTDNRLEALPPEIGHCEALQKLMLAGNRLRALPESLAACRRLELLRIAANRLTALPGWLTRMPRLAWVALGGNPFCADEERTIDGGISWTELRTGKRLGEGASGVIHEALHGTGDGPFRAVAVKVFKGAVTSDGLPASEMAACLRAGTHAHLIPVLGPLLDHPEQARGLVMARIDSRFQSLAGPPSLASCTRDVYPEGIRFSLRSVLALAGRVASVVAHLHRRGVLHGDLYAHNILHDGEGGCLLGDFGAASCLPGQGDRAGLERIEVRAFGCLLEELLARCQAGSPAEAVILTRLRALEAACLDEDVAARPGFQAIQARLVALGAHFFPLPV